MELLGFFFFDIWLLIFISPALLLGLWAQFRVKATYAAAQRVPARMSGAEAAYRMLEATGLAGTVSIEQVQGFLSDHYDPRHKVLRLSPQVYRSRTAAAVGIAAHEAGHAIQDARNYLPLVVRNAAVPMAGIGSNLGIILLMVGLFLSALGAVFGQLIFLAGIVLFAGVVFFQVVNLPVEFNATSRAKAELVNLGIAGPQEMQYVNKVLNAAALTYVAATLQALLTLLYYILRYQAMSRN